VPIRRRIQRRRGGGFRVNLPGEERELLGVLVAELRERVRDEREDPDLRRLFPPAHADDPDAEAEYRQLVGHQLDHKRARAAETVLATLDGRSLSAEEAEAWLTVLNDLRLVLGTRLDVTEEMSWNVDPGDPRASELAVYAYLSWLQEQLVEALMAT
jgi:uncharacterized protein DUF2017